MKIILIVFIFLFSLLIPYLKYNNNIINLKKIILVYCMIDNLGDIINYELLKDLTNKEIIQFNYCNKNFYKKINYPNFSFIGSILDKWFTNKYNLYNYSASPLIIYGTGFIREVKGKKYPIRNIDIRAVRGKNSLKILNNCNVKYNKNIVLADPGLLLKFLYNLSEIKKEHNLCIIPHYIDQGNNILKKINIKGSVYLDIKNKKNFMHKLSKCKRVISSSLHGLIFSDSLLIPNIRMVLSNKIIGGNFKFNDYYSSFNLKPQKYFDLRIHNLTENDLIFIDKNYNITKEMILKKQCDLLINFPLSLSSKYKGIINKQCNKNLLILIKSYFNKIL